MSWRTKVCASIVPSVVLMAGPVLAADDATVLKDLTAVIALQGQSCGQVVTCDEARARTTTRSRARTEAAIASS
jgi:hypothetical protein